MSPGPRWRRVMSRAWRRAAVARRLPHAAWICAALALGNGLIWNLITPAMQGIDEPAHISYVEYMAQHGRPPDITGPPSSGGGTVSALASDWSDVMASLPFADAGPPSWSSAQSQALRQRLRTDNRSERFASGYVAAYPPLYYGLDALVDRAASALPALDRLFFMRLLGAFLFAGTTLMCFCFVRELMPGSPWAWPLAGLAIAFQPVAGSLAGVVTPDNLLFLVSAALFFMLARAFRLGLTLRRGVAIGVVCALGVLTKGTFYGLLPGAAMAVLILLWRSRRVRSRSARGRRLLIAALTAVVAIVPAGIWQLVSTVVLARSGASTTAGVVTSGAVGSARGQISYLWGTFFPRLPGMHQWFVNSLADTAGRITLAPYYPLWDVYIQGFIGRFGWFAFGFPAWVNWLGLGVLIVITAGAILTVARARLGPRWAELFTYATMLVGTVVLVAVVGYRFRLSTGSGFEETRYLFGLLALWGALVVCGVRAFGRYRNVAAGVVVGLLVCDSIGAQLISIAHWYAFPL